MSASRFSKEEAHTLGEVQIFPSPVVELGEVRERQVPVEMVVPRITGDPKPRNRFFCRVQHNMLYNAAITYNMLQLITLTYNNFSFIKILIIVDALGIYHLGLNC